MRCTCSGTSSWVGLCLAFPPQSWSVIISGQCESRGRQHRGPGVKVFIPAKPAFSNWPSRSGCGSPLRPCPTQLQNSRRMFTRRQPPSEHTRQARRRGATHAVRRRKQVVASTPACQSTAYYPYARGGQQPVRSHRRRLLAFAAINRANVIPIRKRKAFQHFAVCMCLLL